MSKKESKPNFLDIKFIGGPKDKDVLRFRPDPMKYIRLAFPEWCVYEYLDGDYVYVGEEWDLEKHSVWPHKI